jgi:hypothetical protein
MKTSNNYNAVDAITSVSGQSRGYACVSLMSMRLLAEMAFKKIVNEY